MGKEKKFACVKCGNVLEVHPPDSVHKYASRNQAVCDRGVKVEQICDKCGSVNVFYWCDFVIPSWYA